MIQVKFITTNKKKLDTANMVLNDYDIRVVSEQLDIPDLYSDKIEDSLNFLLLTASKTIPGYLMASKAGYFINELNEFPGYYTSFVNKTLTSNNILSMMNTSKDRSFHVKTCVGLYSPKDEKVVFFYSTNKGNIAFETQGSGTPLDTIMIRDGQDKIQALYSYEELIKYYSTQMKHYHDLGKFIKSK